MKAHPAAIRMAYDFVQPSYSLLIGRLEAADARLQSTLNFAATLTFAVPALATTAYGRGVNFGSTWFVLAVGTFAVILLIAILTRIFGGYVKLIDPGLLYTEWLPRFETEDQFRAHAIGFAGKDFKQNRRRVNRRANIAIICSLLFGVELAFFFVWIWSL